MDLSFSVKIPSLSTTAQIGDKLSIATANATALFSAEGLSGQKACFVSDRGYFYNVTIVDGKEITRAVPTGAKFVRVEVRNSTDDIMLALTNPVWLAA